MSTVKKVRPPLVSSILILVIAFVCAFIYTQVSGPLEGKMAVMQADGTDSGAVAGSFLARHDLASLLRWGGVIIVVLLWAVFFVKKKVTSQESPASPQ